MPSVSKIDTLVFKTQTVYHFSIFETIRKPYEIY